MIDQRRNKFRRIDLSAGHRLIMAADFKHMLIDQCLCIVDHSDHADCKYAEAGPYQKRLRIAVVDASDRCRSLHIFKHMLEFCTERGIIDLMDLALQSDLFIVCSDASGLSSEMRVVIDSEKHLIQTIFF